MRPSAIQMLVWSYYSRLCWISMSTSERYPPSSSLSRGNLRGASHRGPSARRLVAVRPRYWRTADLRNGHPLGRCLPVRIFGECAGEYEWSAGPRAISRRKIGRLTKCIALGSTATTMLAMLFAPTSAADPTTNLKAEIDAVRSESGCPPLYADPRLTDVSQRVAHEVADYVKHASSFLPTTGENDLLATGSGGLLPVMREAGYKTNKAKLLTGYGDDRTGGPGDNEAKAIKAAVLQGLGFEVFSDCGYTKYGLSAIKDDGSQGWPSTAPRTYAVTTVVLAGDA